MQCCHGDLYPCLHSLMGSQWNTRTQECSEAEPELKERPGNKEKGEVNCVWPEGKPLEVETERNNNDAVNYYLYECPFALLLFKVMLRLFLAKPVGLSIQEACPVTQSCSPAANLRLTRLWKCECRTGLSAEM